MNADWSEQTRLTNNPAIDDTPDWDPATDIEPEDIESIYRFSLMCSLPT